MALLTKKWILRELQIVVPEEHNLYGELQVEIQITPEDDCPDYFWWEGVRNLVVRHINESWMALETMRTGTEQWKYYLARTWIRVRREKLHPISNLDWEQNGF